MAGNPEPDTWEPLTLTSNCPETLKVPRANWYEQVLAPTRNEQYRYIELALPRSDQMLTVEWANAVTQLDRAEAAYATGDDPAVFSHLRGALDALPGAKKHVLDGVSDTNKRSRLDTLLKDAGEFLPHRTSRREAGGAGRELPGDPRRCGVCPRPPAGAAVPHVAPPCRRQPLGDTPYPCTRFPLGERGWASARDQSSRVCGCGCRLGRTRLEDPAWV